MVPLASAVILLSCEVAKLLSCEVSSVLFSVMTSSRTVVEFSLLSWSEGISVMLELSSLVMLSEALLLISDPDAEVEENCCSKSISTSVDMFAAAFETGSEVSSELSSMVTCSESKPVE